MQLPSLTLVLGTAFVIYISHSMWALSQLFSSLQCTESPCFTSYLEANPKLQMMLFTSVTKNPISSEVTELATFKNFDFQKELNRQIKIDLPLKTRQNGTLFLHVVLANDNGPLDWKHLQRDGPTVIQRVLLTDYMIPKAQAFNLLGDEKPSGSKPKKNSSPKPVTHFKTKVFVSILSDFVSMSVTDIPPEMAKHIRVNRKNEFLPIIQNDFLKTRLADLEEVTKQTTSLTLDFNYSPISIGKLRLLLHVEIALQSLRQLGFAKKDVDEVKGIFSDTNVYLLCGTIFVGSIHVLFDFLSFKNDVSFWRKKQSYAGLSMRTTLWRGFSQIVIFLYLVDEHTSLLVLIPAGIGTVIELWKCKKILRIEVSLKGIRFRPIDDSETVQKAENLTKVVDREAMQYLSYVLYPLCVCGAVYSLLYQPHKSWYSWTLNSMVNGVYAFGFLFMLPQLFINYKLKSVAALPWRAFMYKAFNTFIDDIFAFIITMPTAHRLACFRDDIVFVIYLYQRWLYPVDQSRLDDGHGITETVGEIEPSLKSDQSVESSQKNGVQPTSNKSKKTDKKTN